MASPSGFGVEKLSPSGLFISSLSKAPELTGNRLVAFIKTPAI